MTLIFEIEKQVPEERFYGSLHGRIDGVLVGETFIPYQSLFECLDPITNNQAVSGIYRRPQVEPGFVFPARLLSSVTLPERTLTSEDFEDRRKPPMFYEAARRMIGASLTNRQQYGNKSFGRGNRYEP